MTPHSGLRRVGPVPIRLAKPQQRAVDREDLLSAAGFAALRTLPANKVVQRIRGGGVR